MATLKELAQEVGVSPSTISRLLNGYKTGFSLTPEVEKRILDAVKRSGYKANPMFQAIRQKNIRQIAVMMSNYFGDVAGSGVMKAVDVMSDMMLQHGYSFHYLMRPIEHSRTLGVPPWKVSAVVLLDVRLSNIPEMEKSGYPYICLNGVCGEKGNAVQVDEEKDSNMLLEHLYELGHRNICFLNEYRSPQYVHIAWKDAHYSTIVRGETYCSFCQNHGMPVYESAKRIDLPVKDQIEIGLNNGATAFVLNSTGIMLETYAIFREKGLKCPEDVSLVCYNNLPDCEFMDPPLTTIDNPNSQMGKEAGNMLFDIFYERRPRCGNIVKVPGKLIMRQSTGVPCSRCE